LAEDFGVPLPPFPKGELTRNQITRNSHDEFQQKLLSQTDAPTGVKAAPKRAAEQAAPQARKRLTDAVKSMPVQDANAILRFSKGAKTW